MVADVGKYLQKLNIDKLKKTKKLILVILKNLSIFFFFEKYL